MKISTKFMMTIVAILILGAVLMMAWIYYSSYRNTLSQAIRDDAALSEAIHESVYGFMSTGQQQQLDTYLEKARRIKSVNEVRVIRSEALVKELGVNVGSRALDGLDRKVLASGHEIDQEVSVRGARAIRRIAPIFSDNSCRTCHTSFRDGEVIAALSTTLVFQSSLDQMVQNLIRTGLLQGMVILLVIAAIFIMFNRLIMKPLTMIGAFVRKVGRGDLTATFDVRSQDPLWGFFPKDGTPASAPQDEIGELAVSVNKLSADLKKTTVSLETLTCEVVERQKAEEANRESDRKFRAIFDQTFQFSAVMTPEGLLTDVNRAALDFSGIKESDVLGKPIWEAPWWTHAPQLHDRLRAAIAKAAGGEFVREEGTRAAKDGELHYVDYSLQPVKDEAGKVVLLISEGRDITERKKTELELQDTHAKLKESVSQFMQAGKLTAFGELTAGIAHELNQPLNVTKIICQGILRDIEKDRFSLEEAKSDLPQIVSQMNKMAEIIRHMRIFTRKSDGTVREKFELQTVVDDVLRFITQQYKDHNIELVAHIAPGLPCAYGDPIRIEQVFMNLLNNARYAVEKSEKSGKRIEIKIFKHPDDDRIVVEFIDNGIGIPETLRSKMFQQFFTTKDPGVGTGLGLSLCRQIIEEHGGTITFDSVEREGTTFRILLPPFKNAS